VLKGRCYGNRFVVLVVIATWIVALTLRLIPLRVLKLRERLFSNACELVANAHGWLGVHMAEILYELFYRSFARWQ